MADVDMPDIDASSSKGKVAGKSAKITVADTAGAGVEGKKRFEVKKALFFIPVTPSALLITSSGMLSLSGLGILWWITVQSAGITSWIFVSAHSRDG